jgi:hypothetical protein
VRARTAPAAVLAATLATLVLAPSSLASGQGWGRPFALSPSQPIDLLAPQIAIASDGQAAVAFGFEDENNPAYSRAYVTLRKRNGALIGPLRVPGALEVLDLAYDGSTLELLTGSAPPHVACCGTARVVALTGRKFGPAHTLARNLGGATVGRLITLPKGRLLATIASGVGVWASQMSARGRFAPARRLTSGAAIPSTLAATPLGRGGSEIAWTETDSPTSPGGPDRILTATGTAGAAPARARAALTTASGHEIDELALAASASAATVAWIESWFDPDGEYQAQPVVSDLGPGALATAFPATGQTASGLSLSANARGEELLAWKSCDAAASCTVQASIRPTRGRFGAPVTLGAIDAYEDPATAVAPDGASLVGWVNRGQALAAAGGRGGGAFGSPELVSATGEVSGVALSFGSSDQALAAWTQGTSALRVFGAAYRAG